MLYLPKFMRIRKLTLKTENGKSFVPCSCKGREREGVPCSCLSKILDDAAIPPNKFVDLGMVDA